MPDDDHDLALARLDEMEASWQRPLANPDMMALLRALLMERKEYDTIDGRTWETQKKAEIALSIFARRGK